MLNNVFERVTADDAAGDRRGDGRAARAGLCRRTSQAPARRSSCCCPMTQTSRRALSAPDRSDSGSSRALVHALPRDRRAGASRSCSGGGLRRLRRRLRAVALSSPRSAPIAARPLERPHRVRAARRAAGHERRRALGGAALRGGARAHGDRHRARHGARGARRSPPGRRARQPERRLHDDRASR